MGGEKGLKFVEDRDNSACIIVLDEDGKDKVLKSKNLEKFCEFYEEIK